MTRRLLNVLTVLSLLVCAAAAVVFWVRSYAARDRLRLDAFGGQRVVYSSRGRFVLYGLPLTAPAGERSARECVARLSPDDIGWYLQGSPPSRYCGTGPGTFLSPVPRPGSAAAAITSLPPDAVLRPLVAALDDPQRFAAAHTLLTVQFGTHEPVWDEPFDASGDATFNGLLMRMAGPGVVKPRSDGGEDIVYDGPWLADPPSSRR